MFGILLYFTSFPNSVMISSLYIGFIQLTIFLTFGPFLTLVLAFDPISETYIHIYEFPKAREQGLFCNLQEPSGWLVFIF